MRILTTAILLGVTLLVVPLFTWFFGTPIGPGETEVLKILGAVTLAVTLYCFLVGEITRNNSQVDKLWSLLPIVYTWIVTVYGDFSPRLVLMSVLVTLWGIRLTTNFAMKGAYSWRFWAGEEDYRWQVLRRKPEFSAWWKWMLFNLLFISFYQNTLILLFTLPSVVVLQNNSPALGWLDFAAAGAMLLFIILETVADMQQWKFQSRKKEYLQKGMELPEVLRKGFLDKGLWSLSRHPNYFSEQAIWVSFYFFSVAASGQWFNWSITGCLLLMVLFQGSSSFSEEISAGKYPEYAEYQKRVSRFFPLFPDKNGKNETMVREN